MFLALGRLLKLGTNTLTKVQNPITAAGYLNSNASRRHLDLSPAQSSNNYDEDSIKKVCVTLVNELYIKNGQPEGCTFHTKFLDSAAHKNGAIKLKMPTVLAVHGSPGGHEDFIPIVGPLVEKGYRVVALNQLGLFN